MSDLYFIKKDGRVEDVDKAPFQSETHDLEDFILNNERIIGTVILLNRQIEIPNGMRIDLWGIDLIDFRPLILELKNTVVGLEIIPQILPYYQFLRQNPDTIRYKALTDKRFISKVKEQDEEPGSILSKIETDPKVILVAPGFKTELLSTLVYLNLDVEIIKISRYRLENDDLIIHIDKPTLPEEKLSTVRTMETYNWEKYKDLGIGIHKIESAKILYEKITEIIATEEMGLDSIFRKLYIPFQYGSSNIFWIDLGYTSYEKGEPVIFFKLDEKPEIGHFGLNDKVKIKWFEKYKQLGVYFNNNLSTDSLIQLIKKSYEYIVGAKVKS